MNRLQSTYKISFMVLNYYFLKVWDYPVLVQSGVSVRQRSKTTLTIPPGVVLHKSSPQRTYPRKSNCQGHLR